MSGLDDADREDLAAFRELCGPPARRRAANWAALQDRIAAEPRRRSRILRPVAAALLVAASVLLWLILRSEQTMLGQAGQRPSIAVDHEIDDTQEHVADQRSSSGRPTGSPIPEPSEAAKPSAIPDSVPGSDATITREHEAARRRSGSRPTTIERPAVPPDPAPEPTTEETIRAEAALMHRARTALQTKDYDTVLELLREHEARFPTPFMSEEAAAWRAMALCGDGRVAAGKKAAAAFRRMYSKSPQRVSVDRLCPEDSVTDSSVPLQRPAGGL